MKNYNCHANVQRNPQVPNLIGISFAIYMTIKVVLSYSLHNTDIIGLEMGRIIHI